MNIPSTYSKERSESNVKISAGLYRVLLGLSIVVSIILVAYCFLSNSLKVPTTIITVAIFAYSLIRSRSDKINIHVKSDVSDKKSNS